MADSYALGALLRRYRERALLTQEELAGRTGMSARTIRRLESEELRRPRVSTVRLLAAALGLSAAEQATLVAARDGELPVDTGPVVIPRQVPAAPALFTGRRNELDRLEAVLSVGPASKDADRLAPATGNDHGALADLGRERRCGSGCTSCAIRPPWPGHHSLALS